MNEITCRGCGKPENKCTCNLLTKDKVKLQVRIAELEELLPTKEEAVIIQDLIDSSYQAYSKRYDESSLDIRLIRGQKKTWDEYIIDSAMGKLYSKLQAIIDKRECKEEALILATYVENETGELRKYVYLLREVVETGEKLVNAYINYSKQIDDIRRLLAKLQATVEGNK